MNYHQFVQYPGDVPFFGHPSIMLFFVVLVLWEIAWKGYGLWIASQRNQLGWFVAILLLNTLGILPIVYIYLTAPKVKK